MPRRRLEPVRAFDAEAADDEVVAACLQGDAGAWRELVGRYSAYVYAVATRAYRLDATAADEVFQDVWIRVYDGLRGYSRRGEFRAWLRQVVLSACREHFRKLGRRERHLEDAGPEADEAADLDAVERALDVRNAVAGLGEPCRTTLALSFYEDLRQREVAHRLGVPEGTVAARVSRCLKRLKDRLQEDGDPGAS